MALRTANSIYTISSIAGYRSNLPVVAFEPKGLSITYSVGTNADGITIDSEGYFVKTITSPNRTEFLSNVITVYASNGRTISSIDVRLRIVPEITAEYLLVGAGGGGGSDMGGGGGAGGFLTGNVSIPAYGFNYVTVGAGGVGSAAGTQVSRGTNGGFSAILTNKDSADVLSARFYSVLIDGRGSGINFGTDPKFAPGSGAFAFECWIYVYRFIGSTFSVIASTEPNYNPASPAGWTFCFNDTGRLFLNTFTTSYGNSTRQVILLQIWTHVAFSRDATGNLTIWANGENVSYTTGVTNSFTRQIFSVGDYTTTVGTTSINAHMTNARYLVGNVVYPTSPTANITVPTQPLTVVANSVVLTCQSLNPFTTNFANIGTVGVPFGGPGQPQASAFSPFVSNTIISGSGFSANILTTFFPTFISTVLSTPVAPVRTLINNRYYNVHTYDSSNPNSSFTIVQAGSENIEVFLWGGGGAGGRPGGWGQGSSGGAGGAARGEFRPVQGTTYNVIVGGGGIYTTAQGANGGGGVVSRNGSDNQYGGGGGGFSGIFINTSIPTLERVLICAAGGGGGGSSRAGTGNQGGAGGGYQGQDGVSAYDSKPQYRGIGGNQYEAGPVSATDFVNTDSFAGPFQGGSPRSNNYGGAGGGGYYGGSAGGYSESNTMAGGGGGSGYLSPLIVNGLLTPGNLTTPGDTSNPLRGTAGNPGGVSTTGTSGVVIIRYPLEPIANPYGGDRVALGGGAGATTHDRTNIYTHANHGASGGGASGNQTNWANGTLGQGYDGGASIGAWYPAGGGGAGGRGSVNIATGGPGKLSNILGIPYYWAGGGGGAGYSNWGGLGGLGGGGGGAPRSSATSITDGAGDTNGITFAANAAVGTLNAQTNVSGGSGGINTGGGGGGGAHISGAGANGGSGFAVIRYKGPQYFTGGTVTRLGDYTVHAFYSSSIVVGQTYTVFPDKTDVVEGDTINFTFVGVNVVSGTTLYWTLNAGSTIISGDILGSLSAGSFTTVGTGTDSAGAFSITIFDDGLSEAVKTLIVDIRADSAIGPILGTSRPVTVRESLLIQGALFIDVIAVGAGGGGGGSDVANGAGGGSGAVVLGTFRAVAGLTYNVYVGGGGGGGASAGGPGTYAGGTGGTNGGANGGTASYWSGGGGAGGGWSGITYTDGTTQYLAVAGGGGGGGGAQEGNAAYVPANGGGWQSSGFNLNSTSGTAGFYNGADGGGGGGGGGGYWGGNGMASAASSTGASGGGNFASTLLINSSTVFGANGNNSGTRATIDYPFTGLASGTGYGGVLNSGTGANGAVVFRYSGNQKAVGGFTQFIGDYTVHSYTTPGGPYTFVPNLGAASPATISTLTASVVTSGSKISYGVEISTGIPNGATLLYRTIGTATSENILDGRTSGVLSFSSNIANVTIDTRNFFFTPARTLGIELRRSLQGAVLATSNLTSILGGTTITLEFLIIAGGGGGGGYGGWGGGGGGGAGGVLYGTELTSITDSYSIIIGGGGAGNPGQFNGSPGIDTTVTGPRGVFTAKGGGYGGREVAGGPGGSGGGAGMVRSGGAAIQADFVPSGFTGYGNNGGEGRISGQNIYGGGGGGAAGPGGNAGGNGGTGGNAISLFSTWATATSTGVSGAYAGGGGGARAIGTSSDGVGGGGGSTDGGSGQNAPANTGSGGGGTSVYNPGNASNGGSGLVIIRYPSLANIWPGGTQVVSGGYVYHVFRSSGSL